ncbi:hypothetical protein UK23_33325 [Lentzea aerocolonigenes]|uniref:HTH luxR-type domain-containing protein n=1 Tax=Lentzea aerocolonigenes TaxID=68170 RepID=A0A0F0GPV4_LENAE|nr:helix-turn-helix transcriptional regulator [Lentzea aerocolonigenes]KJK43448.1 hypothetical protein UK23_33325 [Lentzea aerocolonigenes]
MHTNAPRLSLVRPGDVPPSVHNGVNARLARATDEVLVAWSSAGHPHHPRLFRQIDRHNLQRGVRYRVLLPDRTRTAPGISARLGAFALAGADIRTTPKVPLDALVIDRALTVLPTDNRAGVAVFELTSVVGTTVELFEHVWRSAAPFTAQATADGDVTERERELLSLLFAGCTDEAIGVRLNISVRTVRRTVSQLMDKLGARSRFQAGAKAADRGWLLDHAS